MNRDFLFRIAAALMLVGVASCTTQAKLLDADLARLRSWYPGDYSNVAQVEQDQAKGVADVREPVLLHIVPVGAMATGDTVFYVQTSDAMNPRRILSQRLHRFEKGPENESLIQTILTLKEPARWVEGVTQPDVFKSIRPDDVSAGPGCALSWKFADEKFLATCPVAPLVNGVPPVYVELTTEGIKLGELSFNGRIREVPSRSEDPLYRFERK